MPVTVAAVAGFLFRVKVANFEYIIFFEDAIDLSRIFPKFFLEANHCAPKRTIFDYY